MKQVGTLPFHREHPVLDRISEFATTVVGPAGGDMSRGLAALSGGLMVLVGVATTSRADAGSAPMLLALTVFASSTLAVGLLVRGLFRLVGMILAIASTTLFAELTFDLTPTVVWLFALVVPAIGLIHGPRFGAVAGLISAPALHWIETGVAVDPLDPLDPLDPQTPFGILILVVLGATPGYLLEFARRRGALLDIQLARAEALVQQTEVARRGEAAARHQAVFMLAPAAEARDGTTGIHIEHVRDLAAAARVVASEIEQIAWSAMLHDVGKIRVPDRVLLKRGPWGSETRIHDQAAS